MQAVYRVLYRIGVTPWDGPGIPAPLMAEAGSAPPGSAVDLGCGTGHQARYLASRGWSVTAVDYLAEVIVTARSRDPDGTVTWRSADVTDLAAVDPGGRLSGTVTLCWTTVACTASPAAAEAAGRAPSAHWPHRDVCCWSGRSGAGTVAPDRAGSNPPNSPACSATAGGRLRCPRPAGTATSEAEAVAGCAPP